jgi:hypothetical protein
MVRAIALAPRFASVLYCPPGIPTQLCALCQTEEGRTEMRKLWAEIVNRHEEIVAPVIEEGQQLLAAIMHQDD